MHDWRRTTSAPPRPSLSTSNERTLKDRLFVIKQDLLSSNLPLNLHIRHVWNFFLEYQTVRMQQSTLRASERKLR